MNDWNALSREVRAGVLIGLYYEAEKHRARRERALSLGLLHVARAEEALAEAFTLARLKLDPDETGRWEDAWPLLHEAVYAWLLEDDTQDVEPLRVTARHLGWREP